MQHNFRTSSLFVFSLMIEKIIYYSTVVFMCVLLLDRGDGKDLNVDTTTSSSLVASSTLLILASSTLSS